MDIFCGGCNHLLWSVDVTADLSCLDPHFPLVHFGKTLWHLVISTFMFCYVSFARVSMVLACFGFVYE